MKKSIVKLSFLFFILITFSSCYTYTHTVGNGPQTGVEVKKANHYFIGGFNLHGAKSISPSGAHFHSDLWAFHRQRGSLAVVRLDRSISVGFVGSRE